jgi:hypothetical protein
MKKLFFLIFLILNVPSVIFAQNKYFDDLSKLSNLKITLSNNRASFFGQTDANQVGETKLEIKTDVDDFAKSAFLLQKDDQIFIGSSSNLEDYQDYSIQDITSNSLANLTTPLGSGLDLGDLNIISPQSGVLKVGFQIDQAIEDGKIRILIPTHSDDSLASDDIPDLNTFDYGSGVDLTVQCPNDQDDLDFDEFGQAEKSALDIDGKKFHLFSCSYSGSGTGDFTENPMIIGVKKGEGNNRRLINPIDFSTLESKKIFFIAQVIDKNSQEVLSSPIPFLLNPNVNVRVSVLPHLTFSLSGKNETETACGQKLDVTSASTEINFGDLRLNYLTKAAINLVVSTNSSGGYVVTLAQSDQMGLSGQACGLNIGETKTTCIPDALVLDMDTGNSKVWEDFNSQYGLAYTLENVNNSQASFSYTQGYRHLPNLSLEILPSVIMTNNNTTHQDSTNICFGLNPPSGNVAGSYENQAFYTVTAKF